MKIRSLVPGPWLLLIAALILSAGAALAAGNEDLWDDYLDFAYVYSSADPEALEARLAEYGREAGIELDDLIARRYELESAERLDKNGVRRKAIAYLLQYLSNGDAESLEQSVDVIKSFRGQKGRHENLYWFHYIMAHQALEKGDADLFVIHMLDLWLDAVAPLESSYASLEAISLSQSSNSGFVSALPFAYENISRLIVIRSQERGLSRDLDPLAAIVRMLHDQRVGTHPDVIPLEASSKPYLDRIVARLDGPESDAGSLTFTLALFQAGRVHNKARALLATQGLSEETIQAIDATSKAYELAFDRCETIQGQAAVHTRVLRQLGEIQAAKQRLGVDPDIETPFGIEDAMEVYRELHEHRSRGEWVELGFRTNGRKASIEIMNGLWQEIQEASLNTADYYLSRSLSDEEAAEELVRSAARVHARYLAFFGEYARAESASLIPDSAYFAAYESARGYADSYLAFSDDDLKQAEIDLAVERYSLALRSYPFDRKLWGAMAMALERQGRSSDYLARVRPVADSVARSRYVNSWIEKQEPSFEAISAMRGALSDDLAIMYLGFANSDEGTDLHSRLRDLQDKRGSITSQLAGLEEQLARLEEGIAPIGPGPAKRSDSGLSEGAGLRERWFQKSQLEKQIGELKLLEAKLDKQIAGRERALPLYEGSFEVDALIPDLRSQRDHPVHSLLRRMFYEQEI
jgi:hypothetical protein